MGIRNWGWCGRLTLCLLLAARLARAEDIAKDFRAAKDRLVRQMRDRKPETRVAAVRKLEEYPIVDAAKVLLLQGLTNDNEDVRQASFDTLVKFKDSQDVCSFLQAEVTKDLKRRQVDLGTSAALGVLLSSESPEVQKNAQQILDKADSSPVGPQLLVTLVDELGIQGDETSLSSLLKLGNLSLFKSKFGCRRALVQALTRIHQPEAVDTLLKILEVAGGETRNDIVQYFTSLSGQSLDNDDGWRKWWNENRTTFQFPPSDRKTAARADRPSVPTYYGLPLYGTKIVFVIDTSTSMRGGRIVAAQRELIRAIRDLSTGVHFNVVAFNNRALAWRKELEPTSKESKAAATLFVQEQFLGPGTASYDALEAALTFDTESIYFLTDGSPVGGKINQPDEIISVISKTNRVRRVTINTIGIGVGAEGNRFDSFLKTLAAQNFGTYRRVDE
jgi:von Willebrand factor type A domain